MFGLLSFFWFIFHSHRVPERITRFSIYGTSFSAQCQIKKQIKFCEDFTNGLVYSLFLVFLTRLWYDRFVSSVKFGVYFAGASQHSRLLFSVEFGVWSLELILPRLYSLTVCFLVWSLELILLRLYSLTVYLCENTCFAKNKQFDCCYSLKLHTGK